MITLSHQDLMHMFAGGQHMSGQHAPPSALSPQYPHSTPQVTPLYQRPPIQLPADGTGPVAMAEEFELFREFQEFRMCNMNRRPR